MLSEAPPPQPTQLGPYEIKRRLGAGGMAEVFLAEKRGAENTVKQLVVKRVLPHHGKSRRFRAMFVAEAQLATRLNHPNIVQVYDFQDIGDGGQLLSMEYVEGTDLGRVASAARQRGARLPPWVAGYIIAEAAKGLHYAHEKKDDEGKPLAIVHRDVSPQNILLSFDGAIKIADFGIASANLFREEAGVLKGKFGFMSPEQARGEAIDRRSDIYALGACLHEILSGRHLHGALAGDDLLEAVRAGNIEPPSTWVRDVPPELEAITMKALARRPEDRFQTARDMAGAISRAMLARQELVDGAVVEGVLARLVGREHTSPGVAHEPSVGSIAVASQPDAGPGSIAEPEDRPVTQAAVPAPLRDREQTGASRSLTKRPREVRHVAEVRLRLLGLDAVGAEKGPAAETNAREQARRTLSDVAWKRGAEWRWSGDTARATVGLWSNASRASADAAWLAVDAREAVRAIGDDLEVGVDASIAIVRGIADGERDDEGRLSKHALQPPAEHLADLLGARATKGAIWVAGGLYRLVRRDFRWGDGPTIDVEQAAWIELPRQLRVYELERALSREERLSEMAHAPSDLVGRDAEKADLLAAYHEALSSGPGGAASIVSRAVVGEMGIGKTALSATFLAELPPDTRVLRVEASSLRSELPFSSVSELVRDALELEPGAPMMTAIAAVEAALGPLGEGPAGEQAIARLLELATGATLRASDEEDASFRRKMVGGAVRRLLAGLGSRQPLVILCDGLQWIDKPSLELLAELVRRTDPLPVLALLVTRPDDRVMPHLDGVVRIDLEGLSHEDQIRLVEARLGVRRGVAQVCAELLPRVAGNPFFLLEMLDALLERGALELTVDESGEQALVRRGDDDGQRLALPSTLEQILGDRLRELPQEELSVVGWLAVASGPLTMAELGALSGAAPEDAVTRLCARGICDQRGESVDFRHTITRDVAYAGLDAGARRALHRELGRYLATTPAAAGTGAAIVARHLARGEQFERAAELYLTAGEAARRGYQSQLAIRWYQRALALLPEGDPRRLVGHEALEAVYRVLGRRKDRKTHLAALRNLAREVEHPKWAAIALARSARLDLDEGHLAHGLPTAERAVAAAKLAKSASLTVEAESTVSELLRELGDMSGALAACDRALSVAGSADVSVRVRAEVLRARGVLLRRLGRVDEAVEAYAEAMAIFKRCGAKRQEARVKNALAMAMLVRERWEDAITLALSSISLDLSIGGRFQIAKTLSNVGQAYMRLGDLSRSLAYLKRARQAHERYSDQDAYADTLLVSAEVMLEAGDLDAAHSFAGDAAALSSVTGSAYDIIHEKVVRALLARAADDHATAVSVVGEARRLAEGRALAAFHIYATAIEAASRVKVGDAPTGTLLARSALAAVEVVPIEYGTLVRALSLEALDGADAKGREELRARAAAHVREAGTRIRDARLRRLFFARAPVQRILGP